MTNYISIITITYNNLNGLKQTIKNIYSQTNSNFQHIIIDGNSNDGTKDYLKSLQLENLIMVSEKDKGIYDAMNKGIKLAQGKWIIFMNAGDTFSGENVLKEFIGKNFKSDIIYGNCLIKYDNGFERISKPKPLYELWKGMSFSHQTVFIKSKLIKQILFDLSYKYCADFNQIYSFYLDQKTFTYWNKKIANIEAGGISDSKRYISTNEVYKINKRLKPKLKNHFYFIPKIIKGFVVVKIKSILPKKLVKKLTKLKYK